MKTTVSTIGVLAFICSLFCACDDNKDEAVCGNNKIESGEGCDGQAMPQKTCQDYGFSGGTLRCIDCSLVMTGCTKCGDFYLDPGELCEKGDLNGQTCQSLGRQGGELACADDCTFDETACHDWQPITIIVSGYSAAAGEDIPLEGATVALDTPAGERIEQLTDAQGQVTFSDIDWTAGGINITFYMDGYNMLTYLGLDLSEVEEDMSLALFSLTPPTPESVTLSGTFTGQMDPTRLHIVNVIRSPVATEWQGTGNRVWGVRAPVGQSFTLQGIETEFAYLPSGQGYSMTMHQVAHQDFTAIDVNTSGAVLDFGANSVTLHTADTWLTLPTRPDSPLLTGSPACWVFEGQSTYSIGWGGHIDISADGTRFDATLVWTEPAWAGGVRTCCQVSNQQGLGGSVVYVDGYPQPGELDTPMDVPRWIAPANPTMAHPISVPLEWELFDTGVYSQLAIQRNGQGIWTIITRLDADSLTPPALPAAVDPEAFLGTAPLPAYLYAITMDEAGERIMKYSIPQVILLAP